MTIIALPQAFSDPVNFWLDSSVNQQSYDSPYGGSDQTVDLMNDRWFASVSIAIPTHEDAAEVEGFKGALRGRVNTVNLGHLVRTEPRGTLRGNPVTDGALVAASQIVIWGAPDYTLLQGDLFSAGGLLLMVAEDCVADGAGRGVVKLGNRVRKPIALNAPVIWDHPTAEFELISSSKVQFIPGFVSEVSFDFRERIG
jgi:hypothetical protein